MRHLVLGLVMALLLAGSAISAGPSANAFITNSGVTDVSVLDTATNGLSAVSIGASTHGVAMDPKGTRVYVAGATGSPSSVYAIRSEEHTSELQSHSDLVCRLLLEKKKNIKRRSRAFRQAREDMSACKS